MTLARGERAAEGAGRAVCRVACRHWCGEFVPGRAYRWEGWAEGCKPRHGTPYVARFVKVFHPAGGYGVFPRSWLAERFEAVG